MLIGRLARRIRPVICRLLGAPSRFAHVHEAARAGRRQPQLTLSSGNGRARFSPCRRPTTESRQAAPEWGGGGARGGGKVKGGAATGQSAVPAGPGRAAATGARASWPSYAGSKEPDEEARQGKAGSRASVKRTFARNSRRLAATPRARPGVRQRGVGGGGGAGIPPQGLGPGEAWRVEARRGEASRRAPAGCW